MKNVFDSTSLGKNRFIRSATSEEIADDKGHITEELMELYNNLAKGGVGTIITSYTYILENEQPSPGMMGIYDDSFINEYKKFTKYVHKNDTKIIMQMVYGGSQTKFNLGERIIWGPSAVAHEWTGVIPKEMTKDDIEILVQAFVDGAVRAKKSGFDGVQLHCAHGYLLSQFLNPYYNRRTDEYGGSIEGRSKIIFNIYNRVREAVGEEFPIWIKINCEDFTDSGLQLDECIYVCKKLDDMNIDAIEISGGTPIRKVINSKEKEAYFKSQAEKIQEEVKCPVILVGGLRTLDNINEILNNTNIEYFSLSRPLFCEPDLINRWERGDTSKAKCVSCNNCLRNHKCILNE